MHYRTLTIDDFSELFQAMRLAFSDYVVPMQPTEAQFQEMLTRRGVIYDLSAGAFEDGKLVGFTLNAVDEWNGVVTGYDISTGVIPAFRGKGIAGALFEYCRPQFKSRGVRQYQLEVIDQNTPAIKAYQKMGFETVRNFECLVLKPGTFHLPSGTNEVLLCELTAPDWEHLQSFWDWQPAWQNSIQSLYRSRVPKTILGAMRDSNCIGYGVIYPSNGDLPQLAVARTCRRQGIGTAILAGLLRHLSGETPVRAINLDATAHPTLQFCRKLGFVPLVSQLEMRLEL
ncbi:MAG TPA: GNAT family N-acetyltransferase [Acidobacteriota bacterium]|nr:GNAT family N-acetyltransferase [Acidobacteriota bacterium]